MLHRDAGVASKRGCAPEGVDATPAFRRELLLEERAGDSVLLLDGGSGPGFEFFQVLAPDHAIGVEVVLRVAISIGEANEPLDLKAMWLEIFEGLTDQQVFDVEQIAASSWSEGRESDREYTARLAAMVRGDMSEEEYFRLEGFTALSLDQ